MSSPAEKALGTLSKSFSGGQVSATQVLDAIGEVQKSSNKTLKVTAACVHKALDLFINDEAATSLRRWVGLFLLELFKKSQAAVDAIQKVSKAKRACVTRYFELDQPDDLRFLAGRMIRQLLNHGLEEDKIFTDSPNSFDEHQFPRGENSQWLHELETFCAGVDEQLPHLYWPTYVVAGKQSLTQDGSVFLTIATETLVVVNGSPSPTFIDVNFLNIEDPQIHDAELPGSTAGRRVRTAELHIVLKSSYCHQNAERLACKTVKVGFRNEAEAIRVREMIKELIRERQPPRKGIFVASTRLAVDQSTFDEEDDADDHREEQDAAQLSASLDPAHDESLKQVSSPESEGKLRSVPQNKRKRMSHSMRAPDEDADLYNVPASPKGSKKPRKSVNQKPTKDAPKTRPAAAPQKPATSKAEAPDHGSSVSSSTLKKPRIIGFDSNGPKNQSSPKIAPKLSSSAPTKAGQRLADEIFTASDQQGDTDRQGPAQISAGAKRPTAKSQAEVAPRPANARKVAPNAAKKNGQQSPVKAPTTAATKEILTKDSPQRRTPAKKPQTSEDAAAAAKGKEPARLSQLDPSMFKTPTKQSRNRVPAVAGPSTRGLSKGSSAQPIDVPDDTEESDGDDDAEPFGFQSADNDASGPEAFVPENKAFKRGENKQAAVEDANSEDELHRDSQHAASYHDSPVADRHTGSQLSRRVDEQGSPFDTRTKLPLEGEAVEPAVQRLRAMQPLKAAAKNQPVVNKATETDGHDWDATDETLVEDQIMHDEPLPEPAKEVKLTRVSNVKPKREQTPPVPKTARPRFVQPQPGSSSPAGSATPEPGSDSDPELEAEKPELTWPDLPERQRPLMDSLMQISRKMLAQVEDRENAVRAQSRRFADGGAALLQSLRNTHQKEAQRSIEHLNNERRRLAGTYKEFAEQLGASAQEAKDAAQRAEESVKDSQKKTSRGLATLQEMLDGMKVQ